MVLHPGMAAWTDLASAPSATALLVYNGSLYAGGNFTQAGGIDARAIARWDSTSWYSLGTSATNGTGDGLTPFNGDVVGCGSFTRIGGVNAQHIARWNGSTWAPMGSGMNGDVTVACIYNGDLIAAGPFMMADGDSANGIARWDGSHWSALGVGVGYVAKLSRSMRESCM